MLGKTGFCLPKGELTIEIMRANYAHMITYIAPCTRKGGIERSLSAQAGRSFFYP